VTFRKSLTKLSVFLRNAIVIIYSGRRASHHIHQLIDDGHCTYKSYYASYHVNSWWRWSKSSHESHNGSRLRRDLKPQFLSLLVDPLLKIALWLGTVLNAVIRSWLVYEAYIMIGMFKRHRFLVKGVFCYYVLQVSLVWGCASSWEFECKTGLDSFRESKEIKIVILELHKYVVTALASRRGSWLSRRVKECRIPCVLVRY